MAQWQGCKAQERLSEAGIFLLHVPPGSDKAAGRALQQEGCFCSMSGENEVGGVALPPVSLYLQIEEKNKNYKGLQCLGVA